MELPPLDGIQILTIEAHGTLFGIEDEERDIETLKRLCVQADEANRLRPDLEIAKKALIHIAQGYRPGMKDVSDCVKVAQSALNQISQQPKEREA